MADIGTETIGVDYIMPEGEAIKQETKEGTIMEGQKVQGEHVENMELLQNIDRKLDLLIAAQNEKGGFYGQTTE